METELVICILSLIGSLCGALIVNSKSMAVVQEQISSIKEDIKVLSNRVDKHNNLVERMALVEASTKSAHYRINHIDGTTQHD